MSREFLDQNGNTLTLIDSDTAINKEGTRFRIKGFDGYETEKMVKGEDGNYSYKKGNVLGEYQTDTVAEMIKAGDFTGKYTGEIENGVGGREILDITNSDNQQISTELFKQGIVKANNFTAEKDIAARDEYELATALLGKSNTSYDNIGNKFRDTISQLPLTFKGTALDESTYDSDLHSGVAFRRSDRTINNKPLGILNSAAHSFGFGVEGVQEGLYGYAQALGTVSESDMLKDIGDQGIWRSRKEMEDAPDIILDYRDVNSIANGFQYVLNTAATSAPYMIGGFAAIAASIPLASVTGPLAAGLLAHIPNAMIYAGHTWNEMEGEKGAAQFAIANVSGVIQASLERLGLKGLMQPVDVLSKAGRQRVIGAIKKRFPKMTTEMAENTLNAQIKGQIARVTTYMASDFAKFSFSSFGAAAAKGTLRESVTEMLQETTQQVAVVTGSDTAYDEEAFKHRLINSGVGGATLGGSLSGAGNVYRQSQNQFQKYMSTNNGTFKGTPIEIVRQRDEALGVKIPTIEEGIREQEASVKRINDVDNPTNSPTIIVYDAEGNPFSVILKDEKTVSDKEGGEVKVPNTVIDLKTKKEFILDETVDGEQMYFSQSPFDPQIQAIVLEPNAKPKAPTQENEIQQLNKTQLLKLKGILDKRTKDKDRIKKYSKAQLKTMRRLLRAVVIRLNNTTDLGKDKPAIERPSEDNILASRFNKTKDPEKLQKLSDDHVINKRGLGNVLKNITDLKDLVTVTASGASKIVRSVDKYMVKHLKLVTSPIALEIFSRIAGLTTGAYHAGKNFVEYAKSIVSDLRVLVDENYIAQSILGKRMTADRAVIISKLLIEFGKPQKKVTETSDASKIIVYDLSGKPIIVTLLQTSKDGIQRVRLNNGTIELVNLSEYRSESMYDGVTIVTGVDQSVNSSTLTKEQILDLLPKLEKQYNAFQKKGATNQLTAMDLVLQINALKTRLKVLDGKEVIRPVNPSLAKVTSTEEAPSRFMLMKAYLWGQQNGFEKIKRYIEASARIVKLEGLIKNPNISAKDKADHETEIKAVRRQQGFVISELENAGIDFERGEHVTLYSILLDKNFQKNYAESLGSDVAMTEEINLFTAAQQLKSSNDLAFSYYDKEFRKERGTSLVYDPNYWWKNQGFDYRKVKKRPEAFKKWLLKNELANKLNVEDIYNSIAREGTSTITGRGSLVNGSRYTAWAFSNRFKDISNTDGFNEWNNNNLFETLKRTQTEVAKYVSTVHYFGEGGWKLNQLFEQLEKDPGDFTPDDIKQYAFYTKAIIDSAQGNFNRIESKDWAAINNYLSSWAIFTGLPIAMLSSLPETLMIYFNLKNDRDFAKANDLMIESFNAMFSTAAKASVQRHERLLKQLGLSIDQSTIVDRYATGERDISFMRAHEAFFRAMGIQKITQVQRRMNAAMGHDFIMSGFQLLALAPRKGLDNKQYKVYQREVKKLQKEAKKLTKEGKAKTFEMNSVISGLSNYKTLMSDMKTREFDFNNFTDEESLTYNQLRSLGIDVILLDNLMSHIETLQRDKVFDMVEADNFEQVTPYDSMFDTLDKTPIRDQDYETPMDTGDLREIAPREVIMRQIARGELRDKNILTYTEMELVQEAGNIQEQIDDEIETGIYRFVNERIQLPGSSNRPLFFQDPHYQLLTQFNGFLSTFTANIIPKLWNTNLRKGNVKVKYDTFVLIILMMGMGGGSQYLKDILKFGKPSPYLDNAGYLQRALYSSGVIGQYERVLDAVVPLYPQRFSGLDSLADKILGESGPAARNIQNVITAVGQGGEGETERMVNSFAKVAPVIAPVNSLRGAAVDITHLRNPLPDSLNNFLFRN